MIFLEGMRQQTSQNECHLFKNMTIIFEAEQQMENLPFHPKYGYYNCDSITGFDACGLFSEFFIYHGFFLQSPLDAYMLKKFGVQPTTDPLKKPFMARWMISNRKLKMGYVNGIINGKKMYTNDIYPNLPDDELLHPIRFNGTLDFIVLDSNSATLDKTPCFSFPNDHFKLTFSGGVMIRMECKLGN